MTTTSPASSYSLNADYWTRIIRGGLDRYRTGLTNPAMLAAAGDVTGQAVLDAGCGEGYLARLFAGRGASSVVGVDLCPELVDAARAQAVVEGLDIRYETADVAALPLDDASVDLVVANHVLNDLEDPAPAIVEFARVLRPGGRAVALLLHPCFYGSRGRPVDRDSYYQTRRIEQHFDVAGEVSPAPVVAWTRPLEDFATEFVSAGLALVGISEPHPSEQQRREDPWWDQNFSRPLFLLLTARKVL
ncbi:class I SAM-dependent methyltransferase [Frankia sp. AgB32]|uniref:class I SAM-dependent methyltransferase n=1 Tax=Frankia sp. AgB32 TaxID=631119 RepID=UPI00200CD50B|nr:class I SAM-dependent methyltransferase [Frankia sp. AgB32]MCK9895212.1 class I SAM-dependent methyltransferase [Frankia sp. AgB32]